MRISFFQKIIDIIRNKTKPLAVLKLDNDIQIPKNISKKINLIVNGKNNKIIFKNCKIEGKVYINIFGDNNEVIFEDGVYIGSSLSLLMGQNHSNFGKIKNSKFHISNNTIIEEVEYITYNSNTFCEIEEDCMLSYKVKIYNTDAHPIFKNGTKEVINKIDGIKIKKHCWIGMNSSILKNSIIPKNSILGAYSVFCGKKYQDKTNCIFAGNPAKIVKEDIDWDQNGKICGYIDNI